MALRDSILGRIKEIDSFFELNFDKPYVFHFEKGRLRLKKLLMYEPESVKDPYEGVQNNKKGIILGYEELPEEKGKGNNYEYNEQEDYNDYGGEEDSENNDRINKEKEKKEKIREYRNKLMKMYENQNFCCDRGDLGDAGPYVTPISTGDNFLDKNSYLNTFSNEFGNSENIYNNKNNIYKPGANKGINKKNKKFQKFQNKNKNFNSKDSNNNGNTNSASISNNSYMDNNHNKNKNKMSYTNKIPPQNSKRANRSMDKADKLNTKRMKEEKNRKKIEEEDMNQSLEISEKNKKNCKNNLRDSLYQNTMQFKERMLRFILTKEEYSILMREKAKFNDKLIE